MHEYLIAIFDDYSQVGNTLMALKNSPVKAIVSLIGLNPGDSVMERMLQGDEEIEESIGRLFTGSLSGSVINEVRGMNQIEVTGLGLLILSGELGDILAASKYISGEKLGGLMSAFVNDLGINKIDSTKYSDYISNGQVLVIVRTKNRGVVREILEDFGALDISVQKILSPK